jgi:8-oxo-dGTP pyrophosphatase MutT (NUDIX family)
MERNIPKIKKVFGKPGFASRAGIIPYTISKGGKVQILLGIKEGRFTDFGGGCKRKEDSLRCALREFTEETLGVLPINIERNLTHILMGVERDTPPHQLIMFVKVKSFRDVVKRFEDAKGKVIKSEHEAVEMMDLDRFVRLPDKRFRKVVRSLKKDIELVLSTL